MLATILYLLAFALLMANIIPQSVLNRLRELQQGIQQILPASSDESKDRKEISTEFDDGSYHPSPVDIAVVRVMMTRGLRLPPDIVDAIFDHAEYWARSTNEVDFKLEHHSHLRIVGQSQKEDSFLLRSYPVGLTGVDDRKELIDELQYDLNPSKPRPLTSEHPDGFYAKLANYPTPSLQHPVRKIVFTIKSKDQGWGGPGPQGSYEGSWTWFEAGLERFDPSQVCETWCTSDARYKSPKSVAPTLSMCALRPIQPPFEPDTSKVSQQQTDSDADTEPPPDEEPTYKYTHGYLPREEWLIQRNPQRQKDMRVHTVQWSWTDDVGPESDGAQKLATEGRGRGTGDGSFVRSLKMGDVVTVWGKAKFGGWVNQVEKVRIDVYWAM